MKKIVSFFFAFAFWVHAQASGFYTKNCPEEKEPGFDSFIVGEGGAEQTKKNFRFKDKETKKYRSVISFGAKKGANFSGHFSLVTWGCGTDCHQFAIVDMENGMVFMSKSINLVSGVMGNDDDRILFKKNSSLIIFSGSINDDIEGKFFFQWKQGRLEFLCRKDLTKVF